MSSATGADARGWWPDGRPRPAFLQTRRWRLLTRAIGDSVATGREVRDD